MSIGRRLLLVLVMLGLAAAWLHDAGLPDAAALFAWAERLGLTSPLWFGVLYATAVILLLPVWWLSVTAGALFGATAGTLIVFVAASIGALASCGLARQLGRDAVARWSGRHPAVDAVGTALADAGAGTVILLRLSPVLPFAVMNVLLGLSPIPLRAIAIGSVGLLPVVALYVGTGAAAGNLVAVVSGNAVPGGPGAYALTALGLLATAAVSIVLTRRARRLLRRRMPAGD